MGIIQEKIKQTKNKQRSLYEKIINNYDFRDLLQSFGFS